MPPAGHERIPGYFQTLLHPSCCCTRSQELFEMTTSCHQQAMSVSSILPDMVASFMLLHRSQELFEMTTSCHPQQATQRIPDTSGYIFMLVHVELRIA
ncbi:hypothetical protein TNIN_159011 [Trichonephila inaurata madagascariensis]|uniref:Uncharacterized protein n=1 Tax=Trichonephila inaurata madagascariensis TaxID=2747483 RepID=A0A8X6IGC3_9ARAC|nr:hypothetical protein TNIN_159011 [Trichonephila inaurata madagascariensis]